MLNRHSSRRASLYETFLKPRLAGAQRYDRIAGLRGNPPGAMKTIAYNTSKAALINFTRTLAGEWGAHGITVSVEPFRAASRPLRKEELHALLTACDIFSPNLVEAETLVGPGEPRALTQRLLDAGAAIVALRMGAEGSLVHRAATGEIWQIPAVATHVVDPVGAGNAYCGALLVGWLETSDLRLAGLYASVAASFLVEQYGMPALRADLRTEAARRLAQLQAAASEVDEVSLS